MSAFSVISDTSTELRRRIFAALESAPDVTLGLTNPETDITFSPPGDQVQGTPILSVFLYRIEPDAHLRNQPQLRDGTTGLRHPPVAVRLRYLVTPLDDSEDQNQLILGRILQHFHDEPFVRALNGTPLDDSFGGGSPEFRIMEDVMSMEQVTQVWSALNTAYRLSVAYNVRVVAIDSDQGVTDARRVVEAHTAVGTLEKA